MTDKKSKPDDVTQIIEAIDALADEKELDSKVTFVGYEDPLASSNGHVIDGDVWLKKTPKNNGGIDRTPYVFKDGGWDHLSGMKLVRHMSDNGMLQEDANSPLPSKFDQLATKIMMFGFALFVVGWLGVTLAWFAKSVL